MIEDLNEGKLPSYSFLNAKMSDAINYHLLLEGLVVERIEADDYVEADFKGSADAINTLLTFARSCGVYIDITGGIDGPNKCDGGGPGVGGFPPKRD